MRVQTYMQVHLHMCVHACLWRSKAIVRCQSRLLFEPSLSLNMEVIHSARLAAQRALEIRLSPPFPVLGYGYLCCQALLFLTMAFYACAGDQIQTLMVV